MTIDIRALAEQSGILMWRDGTVAQRTVDAEDLTRFARAVIEAASQRVMQYRESPHPIVIAEDLRALLPSEPTK